MKFKAIIFDMDGTIINSENLWSESSLHMLKVKGKVKEDKECKKILSELKGASLYTTCAFIKMTYNTLESVEELIQQKEDFVFKNFASLVSFIDGFEQFHHKISKQGMRSAIATNATLSTLEYTTKHFPLSKFFNEHIYCIDHVNKKPKPEPDVFLYAADMIDMQPQECVVIEDSAHGIAAAKAAGMFCIGINTGKNKQALSQADIIVEHYDEIDLEKL